MAVTSIWPIKKRLDRVIRYVCNPEKTVESAYEELAALHTIDGVMEYATDNMKTEMRSYVSCLNCTEAHAAEQFWETKRLWGKTDGRLCYHGYQSFREGEVDAQTAHRLGVELAKRLWGDRFEVVVATHCNTGHYHTHFVINSVSFADGLKFYNSPADYKRMREESDRLCREYALTVIEKPQGRGKNYGEWQAEQEHRPTHRSLIREDIDRALRSSTTESAFLKQLAGMGYELKFRGKSGKPLAYPGLKPPGAKGFFRFHKLGEEYAYPRLRQRILENTRKRIPFPEAEQEVVRQKRKTFEQDFLFRKPRGIHALYARYCYELKIIVSHPASATRVPFSIREDVIRLDQLIAQANWLGKTGIETATELSDYRNQCRQNMQSLRQERDSLRALQQKARRSGNEEDMAMYGIKIRAVSADLAKLRKEVSLCDAVEKRSAQIAQTLETLETKSTEEKEVNPHDRVQSGRRPSRANDLKRG